MTLFLTVNETLKWLSSLCLGAGGGASVGVYLLEWDEGGWR